MNDALQQTDRELRDELRQARAKLDGLVGELHAIDAELDAFESERRRFELVENACRALEQLAEMDAAELFWGDGAAEAGRRQLLHARSRASGFEKCVSEIEERRLALLDAIELQQESADVIAADVLEADREAEQRKHEWLVERPLEVLPTLTSRMPWVRGGEDDARFRRSLAAALALSLLLGLVLPLVDVPLPDRWEAAEVPDRFTQLIREARPIRPIEPREPTKPVAPSNEPSSEPSEAVAERPSPEAPAKEPAPKGAGSKGILAFREKFSALAKNDASERLGAKARISESAESATGAPQRSLVATRAASSSGGINVSGLSRDVGGGDGGRIEGVQIARATSTIGGSGTGSDRPLSDGPGPSRTDEEIQIVFDRHKAALYRLYNRELRRNPTLKGQMVLRMTIEPDGSVSLCEVKSTDMDSPTLSKQVVARVGGFDFGAKEGIPPVTILYPIDFLPAA